MSTSSDAPTNLPARCAGLGRRIFHRRMHVGLAVVAIMAWCIRPGPMFGRHQALGTAISLGLMVLGLVGRAWAAGCAGRHTRLARIEAPRLITGGPYAWVRNPIYLASMLLGLGMVGLLGDPWMLVPCVAVFVFLYASIVPAEEEFLAREFGESYARYRANVPRLVPRLRPWPGAERADFDATAFLYEARLGLVLAAIYAAMRGAAWWRGVV
jgi:protein-S-isoprenylcysteine O-methyltransferase Ste14